VAARENRQEAEVLRPRAVPRLHLNQRA
jgi:hypothetical protein